MIGRVKELEILSDACDQKQANLLLYMAEEESVKLILSIICLVNIKKIVSFLDLQAHIC